MIKKNPVVLISSQKFDYINVWFINSIVILVLAYNISISNSVYTFWNFYRNELIVEKLEKRIIILISSILTLSYIAFAKRYKKITGLSTRQKFYQCLLGMITSRRLSFILIWTWHCVYLYLGLSYK